MNYTTLLKMPKLIDYTYHLFKHFFFWLAKKNV